MQSKNVALKILNVDIVIVIILLQLTFKSDAFLQSQRLVSATRVGTSKHQERFESILKYLFTQPNDNQSTASSSTSMQLLDWNATGSLGALLMQMQKKEEELKRYDSDFTTTSFLEKDGGLDLTAAFSNFTFFGNNNNNNNNTGKQTSIKNEEAYRELDESVSVMSLGALSETVRLKPLEIPPLYKSMKQKRQQQQQKDDDSNTIMEITNQTLTSLPLLPLSQPDHYRDRIGRNIQRLAVSIADSVKSVEQWRMFCQERGGVMPLVQCIQEGANSIRKKAKDEDSYLSAYSQRHEENYLAASNACRTLRDVCAISPELSAVVTDGLLRANVAFSKCYGSSLMDDLTTILKYSDETTYSDAKNIRVYDTENTPDRQLFKERRQRCKLYVTQLLLSMLVSSDSAVHALRETKGLEDVVLSCSSYARKEKTRRWLRYPGEVLKWIWRKRKQHSKHSDETILQKDNTTNVATNNNNTINGAANVSSSTSSSLFSKRKTLPFIEASTLSNDINGRIQGTANKVLAAIGYNQWVPKIPGQRGLRILCMDGGGSRGMVAVTAVKCLVDATGGEEVSDCFDMIVGTSTGAIIAFLVGLRRETSEQAVQRYNALIQKIFNKSALSTPLLLFTTASYDESHFMSILKDILGNSTMLDSRADPAVPIVFGVTSKMSSTPTHVALFRNYNYAGGELPDPFTVDPAKARVELELPLALESELIRKHSYYNNVMLEARKKMAGSKNNNQMGGSRHPGSYRVLQRYALRASTAAPTFFKPVMMGGEMYCDGGIVASNPTAIAIHEARAIFPNIPIELVVSIGTGGFVEQKSAPRIGWDGIIGQIVDSATDGEQIHHLFQDILGEGSTAKLGNRNQSPISTQTRYYRLNPTIGRPDEFPIDVTDPDKLKELQTITRNYMKEPETKQKVNEILDILQGKQGWKKWINYLVK